MDTFSSVAKFPLSLDLGFHLGAEAFPNFCHVFADAAQL